MSDWNISDYVFDQECKTIAQDAWDEYPDPSDSDERQEYIDQTIDGHSWVIYNYKALKIVSTINSGAGEAFLEDIGIPEEPTIYSLASLIVYGEMRQRAMDYLDEIGEAE